MKNLYQSITRKETAQNRGVCHASKPYQNAVKGMTGNGKLITVDGCKPLLEFTELACQAN